MATQASSMQPVQQASVLRRHLEPRRKKHDAVLPLCERRRQHSLDPRQGGTRPGHTLLPTHAFTIVPPAPGFCCSR